MKQALRELRLLLVLNEERHFGRAAERLGVSQPQLSERLAGVEAATNLRLFVRRPRVAPTSAGEALLEAVGRAEACLLAGLAQARRIQDGAAGEVRVGFVSTLMLTTVPEAFDLFRRNAPEVRLQFQESQSAPLAQALSRDEIDVAFVRTPPSDPSVSRREVFREPFVLVKSAKETDGPSGEQPLILFRRDTAPEFHDQILRSCVAAGLPTIKRHQVIGWPSILALVRGGLGFAVGPASLSGLAWPGLRFEELSGIRERTSLWMIWRDRRLSPAARAFVAAVPSVA